MASDFADASRSAILVPFWFSLSISSGTRYPEFLYRRDQGGGRVDDGIKAASTGPWRRICEESQGGVSGGVPAKGGGRY